ncbi:hypothetical protein N1851_011164 [Merluccius polli]|uniref:Uncharacterized protein n=1 Tax=Merluccius polli TaxID=89951 RepID=A0AA47MYP3_MERPO|nr:hypothetical protein N1851_011164 [Merluccius polli]
MSREDKRFLQIMEETTPLENNTTVDSVIMANNRCSAERVISLKRKFQKNKEYHQEYVHFLTDVIKNGYAEQVPQQLNGTDGHYSMSHPQQRAITNAILSDLIIDCNFPLSIVENKSFRHFPTVLDSNSPVCRRTLTSKTENLAEERRSKLKTQLSNTDHVSVTVDMAHTQLKESDQFEAICDEYNIKDKLDYIISDNAANMRKAFSVCFPSKQEDDNDGDHLDDPELWCDLTLED